MTSRSRQAGCLGSCLAQPVHDALDVADGPADPFEFLRDGRIDIGAERRVAASGAFSHHGDGMVKVQTCRVRLACFLHPYGDLLRRPVQRLADLADRSVVAEQQPRGLQRGELAHRGERGLEVKVRGRRRGLTSPVSGRYTPAASPTYRSPVSESTRPTWCLAWPGSSGCPGPAAAEVDGSDVVECHDPVGGNGSEHAEKPVERGAIDHPGAGHQPAGVGKVPRAPLVHDDLGRREHRGDGDAAHWRGVPLIIARMTGKKVGVDTATRMLERGDNGTGELLSARAGFLLYWRHVNDRRASTAQAARAVCPSSRGRDPSRLMRMFASTVSLTLPQPRSKGLNLPALSCGCASD